MSYNFWNMNTFNKKPLTGQGHINDAAPPDSTGSAFLSRPTPSNPWKGKPSKMTDDKLRSSTTIGPDDVHHYKPRTNRPPYDGSGNRYTRTNRMEDDRPRQSHGAERDFTRNSRQERHEDQRASTRQQTRRPNASKSDRTSLRARPPLFFENPAEKGTPEWITAEVENMTQYF